MLLVEYYEKRRILGVPYSNLIDEINVLRGSEARNYGSIKRECYDTSTPFCC
jgi:hypothetical protein